MISQTSNRRLTYASAIREATFQAMEKNTRVIVFGEGVPDPKGIFGTTSGLFEKFGASRVFDTPLSENGVTGAAIGLAISGFRPIMVHQRVDFSLLSLDQIINNAAKWRYMFDEKSHAPIIIRMIVGRGWGQGPQHAQSLQALYGMFHGLVVLMPSTPKDAKGMLLAALEQNDPVIFIEHRWLHNIEGPVPEDYYTEQLTGQHILKEGSDLTLVAVSHMVPESLEAAQALQKILGIKVEVVDLRVIRPLDLTMIKTSLKKTRKLVVADTANETATIAHEIITKIVIQCPNILETPPSVISSPAQPVPTSHFMADGYYPDSLTIAEVILSNLNVKITKHQRVTLDNALTRTTPHDKPFGGYNGPF